MRKRQNTRFKEKKTGETMLDQSVFTETIHEVAEIIRTSATPLSKEEILSYFKEMELNEQQENMVLEFLLTPHEEEEAEEETEEAEGGEQSQTFITSFSVKSQKRILFSETFPRKMICVFLSLIH